MKIGDRFGEWTIIGKSDKPGYAKCRCSCGRVYDVKKSNLSSGRSTKCMAHRSHPMQAGDKFGSWTVIKDDPDSISYVWCQCSCGEVHRVYKPTLLNGTSTRCGVCKRGSKKKTPKSSMGKDR